RSRFFAVPCRHVSASRAGMYHDSVPRLSQRWPKPERALAEARRCTRCVSRRQLLRREVFAATLTFTDGCAARARSAANDSDAGATQRPYLPADGNEPRRAEMRRRSVGPANAAASAPAWS